MKAPIGFVCALGVFVSACNSDAYLDRRETLSPSAGEALERNAMTMAPDPWPAASRNKEITTPGAVTERATKLYRCGTHQEAIPGAMAGHSVEAAGPGGAVGASEVHTQTQPVLSDC